MFPQEGELLFVLLKLHNLLPEMGRHLRRILPLPGLAQQIEIVDVQGHKSGVLLGIAPAVRLVLQPVDDGRAVAGSDLIQVPLDSGADAILSEQRIFSARYHELFLTPKAETEAIPMLDLIALMLHDEEEVTDVVGVLDGLPQIRLQHGAEGGLALALPQPLDVTDRLFSLTLQDNG